MVDFFHITFDKDWVSAEAYDHDFRVKGTVKASRHREEFYTDCMETNQFMRASWHMVMKVNDGKLKQDDNYTVAWG